MIIKILFTLFVFGVNFLIFRKINQLALKPFWVIAITVYGALISLLNCFLEILPSGSIFFLIVFSASLIILDAMSRRYSVTKRTNLVVAEKYQAIKYYIVKKVFIIMVSIFQLLLIWYPTMFKKMTTRPPHHKVNTMTDRY